VHIRKPPLPEVFQKIHPVFPVLGRPLLQAQDIPFALFIPSLGDEIRCLLHLPIPPAEDVDGVHVEEGPLVPVDGPGAPCFHDLVVLLVQIADGARGKGDAVKPLDDFHDLLDRHPIDVHAHNFLRHTGGNLLPGIQERRIPFGILILELDLGDLQLDGTDAGVESPRPIPRPVALAVLRALTLFGSQGDGHFLLHLLVEVALQSLRAEELLQHRQMGLLLAGPKKWEGG